MIVNKLARQVIHWIGNHQGLQPTRLCVSQEVFDLVVEELKPIREKRYEPFLASEIPIKDTKLMGITFEVDPTMSLMRIEP